MFLNRWSGWTGFLLVGFFACWAFWGFLLSAALVIIKAGITCFILASVLRQLFSSIGAVTTWINLERPHTVMFSYHSTIAWQCGICDSLSCLFYLTVGFFFFFLCCMCVCSFSLFDKSLLSGAATILLMLLFLIFHSPLACYNVHRFVASSLFSCCSIILYVIYACYSCVDGTEIKDTN